MSSTDLTTSNTAPEPSFWYWAATLVGLATLAGSLYLSLGMGLKACPLCLYQRAFVMGVVGVLVVGLFVRDAHPRTMTLLALPLSASALGVAGFHCYLEYTGFLECPAGIPMADLETGSAPQQSLAALSLLTLLLIFDQLRAKAIVGVAGALALGAMFAFSSIRSAPAAPRPDKAYLLDVNEEGCRRPYVPPPAPDANQ